MVSIGPQVVEFDVGCLRCHSHAPFEVEVKPSSLERPQDWPASMLPADKAWVMLFCEAHMGPFALLIP